MYKPFQNATLLPTELTTPDYKLGEVAIPAVSVSAARGADGALVLSLVNTDPNKPARVTAKISGAAAKKMSARVLTTPAMNAHNTFDAAQRRAAGDLYGRQGKGRWLGVRPASQVRRRRDAELIPARNPHEPQQARFPAARGCAHAVAAALPAQAADTLRAGFSTERLARVDALLDSYVNDGRIAGVVALVLRDGKPVYERAVGWADKEAGRKMTMDTEFRIASQSKALTSVAILQLMEEGKLTVNERAGKYIPTFEQTTVLTRAENSTTWTTVAAKRPITIKDLLTHTAGINYGQQPEFAPLYEPKGLGPGGRFRLVLRRQGRAHLHDHGAARHAALRSAARRALRLRLQHRHPGLHRREGVRACRSMSSSARTSPVRSA